MSEYRLLKGMEAITPEAAQTLLKQAYWATNRPLEVIRRSMEHSMCYGVFSDKDQKLVAFARVMTDYAVTYYICDVIVDESHRGLGLSRMIMDAIESAPETAGLRGILATRDAHGLYAKYGFVPGGVTFMQKLAKKAH